MRLGALLAVQLGLLLACGSCGDKAAPQPRRVAEAEIESIAPATFEGDDGVERCVHAAGRLPDEAERAVRTFCAETERLGLVGASLAIHVPGKKEVLVARGHRCEGRPERVDPKTRFPIGSITKTATALMALEALGPRLDERPGSEGPSWRQLLQHRGGVPNLPAIESPAENWRARLAPAQLDFPPGELWNYSNNGYVLVAMALAELEALDFAGRFAERFSPLGLGLTPGPNDVCEHQMLGELRSAVERPDLSQRPDAAAGGALASPSALLALAAEAQRHPELVADPVDTAEGDHYGLGVRVREEGGHRLYGHRGSTGGAWARLMWDERGRAAALTVNEDVQLDATVMALRRDLFGLEAETRHPPAPALEDFVGQYAVPGWSLPLEVRIDASGPRLDIPELGVSGLELVALATGAHRITWPLSGLPVDLRFLRNAQGRWIRAPLFVGHAIEAPAGGDASP